MLQSQFNLDHRLAELRQAGAESRRQQAARAASRPGRSFVGSIRSFVGTAAERPAELAAH
jgi:hypothetical protein